MTSLDTGLAARLIAGLRANTTGATHWDTAGIAAALRDVGGTPGAAFAAAALAAEDVSLVKPSAAGFRNHWPTNAGVTGPRVSYDVPCVDHPTEVHPCPVCPTVKTAPPPIADPEYLALKAGLSGKQGPHPKFAPPKADQDRAAHLDRLRQDMEAS